VSDILRVGRLYFFLLALFTVGRWAQSLSHAAYDRAHHVFSIVTLTFLSAAFFAAFCRRWRGYSLPRALLLGLVLGLSAQVVIFLSTVISYELHRETFFNHPHALNSPQPLALTEALVVRARGLVAGPLFTSVAAAIGWVMGAALPEAPPAPAA
jgi:hypothetical protein